MRVPLFIFLLVLTLEASWAVDTLTFDNCESLGIDDCDGFRQIDISVDEQKKLFSSILEIKDNENIHDFIFDWNTNLAFNEIPYSVLPKNHQTIGDAWLTLSCVMPSVLYGDTLYNNYSGHVQTNYGYDLGKPATYFNGEWRRCTNNPPTSGGDCRTEYPQNWDKSQLNTYLNNRWIANTSLVTFNTTETLNNFESTLNIVNKIQRDRYRWAEDGCCECKQCCWYCGRRICCGRDCGRCGCDKHWRKCISSST
ncbi:MAG: hypothetical protein U9O94_05555, partial [Nanoarchaeota archaeon]|nr:hypothetical protein [Nanoarchaeota archaeon]